MTEPTRVPTILTASGDDSTLIHFFEPLPDIERVLAEHQADGILAQGNFADLEFLRPAARVLNRLFVIGDCADASAVGSLTRLEVLRLDRPPTLSFLGRLPRLVRLVVEGPAPWADLAACESLRELIVLYGPFEDFRPLEPVQHLEYLRLDQVRLSSFAGVDKLPRLRSLVLRATTTETADCAEFMRDRFGFDVNGLVAHTRSEVRKVKKRVSYLHADRVQAERVARARPPAEQYATSVTIDRPGGVVLLIDRSGSTRGAVGEDFRAKRKAEKERLPEEWVRQIEPTLGVGMPRCDVFARAVNRFLPRFRERCGRDASIEVAIVEYGERVGVAWSGALTGRTFVPIEEVAANPLRVGPDGPVWVEPVASGQTPMYAGFAVARELVADWCAGHPDSYPPVVINLNGVSKAPGDVYRDAWSIRRCATNHGPALLFTVTKQWSLSCGVFGSEELITSNATQFRIASPMPASIRQAAERAGYPLLGTVRGAIGDASPDDFDNALHIFTALPGLRWTDDLIHHGLPPYAPSAAELKDWAVRKASESREAGDWPAPRLPGPMTEELFWKILEKTRHGAGDSDEQGDRILDTLAQFDESDLVAFDQLLDQRLAACHRWDLWAVAFIAKGGCSDDAFEYFQCWLVSQGRKYFESALANPPAAAKRIAPGDEAEFERLRSLAIEAYEAKTGRNDFLEKAKRVAWTLEGDPWEEEDLPKLYPRLSRKYQ
jgi:hypothetical protein